MLDKITYDLKGSTVSVIDEDLLYKDPKSIKRFLNIYENIKNYSIYNGMLELVDICIDIDYAIKRCGFNQMQMTRLTLWMKGYSETDISSMIGINKVVVHNFINSACAKISKELGV